MTLGEAIITGLVVGMVVNIGNYFNNKYLLSRVKELDEKHIEPRVKKIQSAREQFFGWWKR